MANSSLAFKELSEIFFFLSIFDLWLVGSVDAKLGVWRAVHWYTDLEQIMLI